MVTYKFFIITIQDKTQINKDDDILLKKPRKVRNKDNIIVVKLFKMLIFVKTII